MRLINIEDTALLKTVSCGGLSAKALWKRIKEQPTIDAVEVVRCKDCKKYETLNYTDLHTGEVSHKYVCKMLKRQMLPRDFCSCGQRREDGEEE